MPYLSLYRKYRPRGFAEIVGQRHVTQTLANAVKTNRIAHAYLFCGPRGTGKTTTARALAAALNCEKGPTAEPCGVCEACRRINAGNALDVIEIDAASNRGIDEIRELRERVGLAAAGARMKVYIIDEVHMLTGEAFNAFLKTLEEPPSHVVFVLATTEPHRVLPTILSRCQRFDFHRIGLRDLETVLAEIGQKEELTLDPKALSLLAHAADGSFRDALTLLDQAIAYAEGDITAEVVTEILGGIDFELLADLTDSLSRRDLGEALIRLDKVVADGKDLRQLVIELIGHYRNLLLLRVDRRGREAVALPEESAARAESQARALSPEEIVRVLDLLAEADRELRFTSQPRLIVELAVARVCQRGMAESTARPSDSAKASAISRTDTRKRASSDTPSKLPAGREETAQPEVSQEATGTIELGEIKARWDEVIAQLRQMKRTAEAAFLRDSVPVALENGTLTLSFEHQFHHDQMNEKRREVTADAVETVFGSRFRIACRMGSGQADAEKETAREAAPKRKKGLEDVLSMFPGSEVED
ncbi:MAG: DNA polymerase III subunit gamma/tau [Armatimonadetes bacterium]|nr:DNA polymerase III subunit gamma/tau [Armatimonadota bacterium]